MPNVRRQPYRFPSILAAAGAGALAASAVAGVSVSVDFSPSILVFEGADPVYFMGVGLAASGFADDDNLDNFIRVESDDQAFAGDLYPARHTGTGTAGSRGFASIPELIGGINAPSGWTITLVDGVTGVTSRYAFSVAVSPFADDYLRAISLDVTTGQAISDNPTFTFSQPPASFPEADYNSAYAFILADSGAFYINPPISPSDTQWTPEGPVESGVYLVVVQNANDAPDQALLQVQAPVPQNGAAPLTGFSTHLTMVSTAETTGLTAGNPTQFSVTANFQPAAISFAPLDPPVYILGLGLQATGFADESNIDNFIEMHSQDNAFSSDFYPARGTGSGTAGSIGAASPEELSALINAQSQWTLKITDGQTLQVREYTLDITTPGIAADYLRPILLDVNPGDVISQFPTIGYTQASSSIPSAQFTSAFSGMFGSVPANSVFSPAFGPDDSSWSPDGPLAPDTYTVLLAKINDAPPQNLIQATVPVPVGSARPLTDFGTSVTIQIDGQCSGVIVGAACPADFNGDSFVDPDDLSDYIACFFASPPCSRADFNHDGFSDPDDLSDYIALFFTPGHGC